MPKGFEDQKNARKKAKLTLKEKRLKKKEKKAFRATHDFRDVMISHEPHEIQ